MIYAYMGNTLENTRVTFFFFYIMNIAMFFACDRDDIRAARLSFYSYCAMCVCARGGCSISHGRNKINTRARARNGGDGDAYANALRDTTVL